VSFQVELTGLEVPGCQAEVRSDGTRSPESRWVIDPGLERQCGNKANTGRRISLSSAFIAEPSV